MKEYTAEQAWVIIKNIQRTYPNLFSRETLEKLAQHNILDYSYAQEALSIADAVALSQENIKVENNIGDDLTTNKFDAELGKTLANQRINVDSKLQMAMLADDHRVRTIKDIAAELDELTKEVMNDPKYKTLSNHVFNDIKSILDNDEEIKVINDIMNTEVRTMLNDDGGDKTFKGTDNHTK